MTTTETTEATYTPYQGHLLVNKLLADAGVDRVVKPQMIYNYVRKGTIKSTLVDGKARVTKQQIREWVEKYIAKINNTSSILDD